MLYSIISITQNTYNKNTKQIYQKFVKRSKQAPVIKDIVAPAEQEFQNNKSKNK